MGDSLLRYSGPTRERSASQRAALRVAAALLLIATGLFTRTSLAEDLIVPVELQVALLDRVVRFERNWVSHAGEPVRITVVRWEGIPASERAAAQALTAFKQTGTLGERPAIATVHTYSSAVALLTAAQSASIIYVMPGFSQRDLTDMTLAFKGTQVLTVTASAAAVESGLILGFELDSSRPRIVVNLLQAQAQKLDFSARLLRLARVIQ